MIILKLIEVRGIFSANNKVGQEFTFQTNSSSGTTFDPTIQMSGSKRASWNLDEGGSYFAGNLVSYVYPNGFTKNIKLRTNRLTDVTLINMQNDSIIGNLDLTEFTKCLAFEFNTNPGLTGVTLPTTSALVNSVKFWACNLHGNFDLSTIPNFRGALYLTSNINLTGLTIPLSNTNLINQFSIDNCNFHGRVDLSGYTNLGGIIDLSNNVNITGVTFPNSTQNISRFYIGNNGFTHDLNISGLTGFGGSIQFDGVKSSNIILPNSVNSINSFNIGLCNYLTSVDLTMLPGISHTLVLQANTGVTSYTLPSTSNLITNLSINQNYSLPTLDLSPLSGMSGSTLLANNTSLTNLILPTIFGGPVTSWDIKSCNIPASGVNYVLYTIDNTGWTGGTLSIEGGGNSAPDGSSGGYDGDASILSLISKDWSITTT